jgi:hypothetical protein
VYSNTELSPTQHAPYSKFAAQEASFYLTQEGKVGADAVEKQDFRDFDRPARLIFGKCLVGGSTTGDVFEGVIPGAIFWGRTSLPDQDKPKGVSLELGGPWKFYQEFWRVHNIEHLADLLPVPEMAIRPDVGYLYFSRLATTRPIRPKKLLSHRRCQNAGRTKTGTAPIHLPQDRSIPFAPCLRPRTLRKRRGAKSSGACK